MNGNEESADLTSVCEPLNDVPSSSDQPMDEEILVCPICTKTFELPTTYHTHLRLSHRISKRGEKLPPLKKGENKSDVKVKKEKPTNYPCPQCKWVFTTEPNLKRHMKNLHPSDNEERLKCGYCEFETTVLYYLKRHIQRHTEEENKTKYKCQYCDLKFDDLERLKNHETNKHKNGNKKKINYCKKCPKCSFVSTKKTRDEIVAHFKNAHNIDFAWQSFTFDSVGGFEKWKSDLEKSISVQYKCRINFSFYACSQSGTNGFCPSAICVRKSDDGSVHVTYLPSHVGHELNYTYVKSIEGQKIGKKHSSNSTSGSDDEDDSDTLASQDEDALASNALIAEQQNLTEDRTVLDHEPNEILANQRRNLLLVVSFREKLQKFVDYCQTGAKSREQIAYLETVMEQAIGNAEAMQPLSHP